MANRSLLRKSKIEDFKSWLQEDGWQIEPTKGIYEIVRATKGTRKPLIVYTRDNKGKEHLTVQDRDLPVVRAYIRDRRREARAKANGIQKVTKEEMLKIIDTREPLGKFYRIEGKTIIAVDNSTGDAWTEEFKDFETFLLWITTQLTVEEAEEIIKGRGNKCATKCVGWRRAETLDEALSRGYPRELDNLQRKLQDAVASIERIKKTYQKEAQGYDEQIKDRVV